MDTKQKSLRRAVKIHLKGLTDEQRQYLRLLSIHTAKIYNAALWCCRQHYIHPNHLPDSEGCQSCSFRTYFESPQYLLTTTTLARLDVPEEIKTHLKCINGCTRETFDAHLQKCLSLEDYQTYAEIIRETAKFYRKFLSKTGIDKIFRHGAHSRIHYEILGKPAQYAVFQALRDVDNYEKLLKWYLKEHHLSSVGDIYKGKPHGKYLDAPRLPGYKRNGHQMGVDHDSDETPAYGQIIFQVGNGISCPDSQTLRLGLSTWMKQSGYSPLTFSLPHIVKSRDFRSDQIREVRITPKFHGTEFFMSLSYELPQPVVLTAYADRLIGIDMGVDNLATCVDMANCYAFLIDGKPVKSVNWWYNKRRARLKCSAMIQGSRTKYHVTEQTIETLRPHLPQNLFFRYEALQGQSFETAFELLDACFCEPDEREKYQQILVPYSAQKNAMPDTRRLFRLTQQRNARIEYYMQQAAHYIVEYCQEHQIGTLIVGVNKGWKQQVELGKRNNQLFVGIPFLILRQYLQYACEEAGLYYIEHEESYTSKCSFLDHEPIEKHEVYLGQRGPHGLFRTVEGHLINADCNGAANIAVKGGNWQGDRPPFLTCLRTPKKITFR